MPTHPLHGGVARATALVAVAVLTLGAFHVSASGSGPATTTVAGDGTAGFAGDGGPGTSARLSGPASVAVDGAGNVVIADTANHRIRRLDAATGMITTLAGDGMPAFAGDGGPATEAQLNGPAGVAIDGAGNVVIADTANHRVRRRDAATGVITTLAGDGMPGFAGDGGPATEARLNGPAGVAIDGAGNVVIADTANHRVRRLDAATGVITTLAGDGMPGFAGDGGPATEARLNGPAGVAIDGAGNVVIADTANHRVRRLDAATGVITTLAGDGMPAFAGDDGGGTSGRLSSPAGVAVTRTGNIVIADTANRRIRRLDAATGQITTIAADGLGPVHAPAAGDPPPGPRGVAVDQTGATLVANTARNRIDRVESPFKPGAPVAQPAAPAGSTSVCDLVGAPDRAAGTVSVDTPTAVPGQELALQGNGFQPWDRLTVTLCSVPRLLGAITADPTGAYQASVRIPADADLGSHHLVISDGRGNAAVALTVAQADDPENPFIGGRGGVDGGTEDDPEVFVDPMTDEELAEEEARLDAELDAELDAAALQDEIDAGLAADAEFAAGLGDTGMATTGGDFGTLLKLASLSLVSGLVLVFRARRSSIS